MTWKLTNPDDGTERVFESRSAAEDAKDELEALGDTELVLERADASADGGETVSVDAEVVDHTQDEAADSAPSVASESVPDDMDLSEDPLDILPGYMIDHVEGQPALNKRGLSVLAFQYGISVEDREVVVSPHESEWEYAIVETTVTNEDGNVFVGTGTAHVDRGDDKTLLLEMSETRSYKRAVSFATGTGIVSYQELVNELE